MILAFLGMESVINCIIRIACDIEKRCQASALGSSHPRSIFGMVNFPSEHIPFCTSSWKDCLIAKADAKIKLYLSTLFYNEYATHPFIFPSHDDKIHTRRQIGAG
jgi:hypothetical protein